MFLKLSYIYLNFKRDLFKYKSKLFFKSIENIVSQYLKVYIIKPNVLIESEDVGFKNIGLYNIKDSMLNKLSFEERLTLFNKIKIDTIHLNNCMYFSYNEKNGYQPIIFTIWAVGEELRIGCFISKDLDSDILKKQKEKINKLFRMFESPLFMTSFNEIDRNDYSLSEVIITNTSKKSFYDSIDKQNFIGQIFAQVISQNILEYLENIK